MVNKIKTIEEREEELIKNGKEKGYITYETLAEAVAAATNGTVITLLAGEYDLSSITIDKNITIEGPNGFEETYNKYKTLQKNKSW